MHSRWTVLIGLLIFAMPACAQTQTGTTPASESSTITVGQEKTLPPWADDIAAVDTINGGAYGPSAASTVYLGSGAYQHKPMADVSVYNPTGPKAVFSRLYETSLAANGYASPGLSVGWAHGFDDTIIASSDPGWGKMTLRWCNGAQEELTPVVKDGKLTGELTAPRGAPYLVVGQPSTTPGQWNYIELKFRDQSSYTFGPDASNKNLYRVRAAAELAGKPMLIYYDAAGRLDKMTQGDYTPLMTFAYDANGYLSRITEHYGKGDKAETITTTYAFGPAAGTTCLLAVSQKNNSKAARWAYGYTAIGGRPFVTAVGVPSPSGGNGMSVKNINYGEYGRVSSMVDANKNEHRYIYGAGEAKVEVRGPSGEKVN